MMKVTISIIYDLKYIYKINNAHTINLSLQM